MGNTALAAGRGGGKVKGMASDALYRDVLLVLPAWNEAESLRVLLPEVRRAAPGLDVLVVNDGSTDETAAVARAAGARVLDLH